MNIILHLTFLLITIILSAFFSGSESAIFSLTEHEKQKIKQTHKKVAESLKKLLDNPPDTISLIITGNTFVNTIATSILGVVLAVFYPRISIPISILIVTSIILILGEVIPKLFALRMVEKVSIFAVYFLSATRYILTPLKSLFTGISSHIASRLGWDINEIPPSPLLREIYAIVRVGEERGILEKGERVLAEKVLSFGKRWVKEIMTPRVDICGLDKALSKDKVLEFIRETKHTKYPVYIQNLDNVVGVIYVKDLLFKDHSDWRDLIQPIFVIPEFTMIDELLQEFRERDEEIALVVDEYGGTAGLVTLEDILEELVGEIEDEYKKEIGKIEIIDENTVSVPGNISLRELGELFKMEFEENFSTLSGLLLSLFQKIPSSGQSFEYKGL
jgi:putative hemolysin